MSGGGSPSAAAKLQQATSAWRSERKVDESERVKTPEAPTEDPSRVKNRWAETPSRSGSKTPRSVTAPSSSSNKDVKGLAKDLKSAWTEFGGSSKETGVAAKGANGSGEAVPRLMEHAENAVFVHFIPPPLRAEGKKDLSWIVHTCGYGCYECRRVSFHSVSGFTTYETAPPEVAEGLACGCQIANHHLRGYGKVRIEPNEHVIIEDVGGCAANVDGRVYMKQAKQLSAQLKAAQGELREMRRKVMDKKEVYVGEGEFEERFRRAVGDVSC